MKDYHTHLDLIDDDLDKIIERARKAGVNGFIVPGVCGFPNKLDELIKYPEIGICWGIYPKYAETDGIFERELVSLKRSDIDVVAIGECGLDKRFPDIEKQTALFKKQIDLANQLNKPLIVHLVGHFQLAYELLKTNLPKAGFTMHSWSGSVEMCAEFVKLGANISLSAGALKNPEKEVSVALVGKYVALHDAYLSVVEALKHGGIANKTNVNIKWIDAEDLTKDNLESVMEMFYLIYY